METYHFILCTALLFIQEEMEGFQTTIICWLLVLADPILFKGIGYLGFNFYEAVMIVDLIFIILTLTLYDCHKNVKLIGVFVVSFFLNFMMLHIKDISYYTNMLPFYKGINILLFELLIWYCIITSRLHPYINKANIWVDTKLNKYMLQGFKYDN